MAAKWMRFSWQCNSGTISLNLDMVLEALLARGIECGIHYKPNHTLTKYNDGKTSLPVAERLHREVLALPFHPLLTEDQQDTIVTVVEEAIKE